MKEIQFHLNVLLILGVHLSTGVSLIHCYQNTSATLWGSEELPGHGKELGAAASAGLLL